MSDTVSSTTPRCAFTQEVRLAIVMYGGVSLAIYINGVTQELYHLVRATAPANADGSDQPLIGHEALTGTERVYRKLGQILSGQETKLRNPSVGDPIRTRFVVDILSGTSAGGINAIFLAKALANNQRLDDVQQLWIEEGDIALLLNDKFSATPSSVLTKQKPPQSLLNSRRMYFKLLKAFDDMEKEHRSAPAARSPYGNELDLFVTATDIVGVTVPLRLADTVVHERRHKNVFHFKYYTTASEEEAGSQYTDWVGTGGNSIRNDFTGTYNPFLAFAARCTSSFPFAFEPMRLDDIDGIVSRVAPYNADPLSGSDSTRWERFIGNYGSDSPVPFSERSFGDGGYLDNKPFSYAIDSLMTRQANFPVDRKLIYIEPAPEHPEDTSPTTERPDAIQNVDSALLVLPRYETIREDLQRVLQRNSLVERINRITRGIEEDVRNGNKSIRGKALPGRQWAAQDLANMIKQKGIGYGGYQRLKVGAVTDEIAELIARAAGLDEDSDQLLGIRYLVRAWRSMHYAVYKKGNRNKATENKFILQFDLGYRLRRLSFVHGKLDVLHGGGEDAEKILGNLDLEVRLEQVESPAFREELLAIRTSLSGAFTLLNGAKNALRARGEKNPLRKLVLGTGISPAQIKHILEEPTDNGRLRMAQNLLKQKSLDLGLDTLAEGLSGFIHDATRKASAICANALDPGTSSHRRGSPQYRAREILWHYYQFYDDYDMITFPVLYSAGAGELDVVEVIRISPEDATSLIDVREEQGKARPRSKLAGTTLANFGGFLDRAWRENDILWGRLDGAERIISAMLPGPENEILRTALIREAQEEILREDLRPQDKLTLSKVLTETLLRSKTGVENTEDLKALVERELGRSLDAKAEALLRLLLNEDNLLEYFHKDYSVNRDTDPEATLKVMSRASRIVGDMLQGLADRHNIAKARVSWVARFGQMFWSLVIVAVPGSLLSLMTRYWLNVLYVFEALLILTATLLTISPMQQLGFTLLAVTAGAHLIILFLQDYMLGKKLWRRVPVLLLGGVMIFLAALGTDALFGHPVMNWVVARFRDIAAWFT